MKTALAVCVVLGVMVTFSGAQRTIEELEGVYSGDAIFPTFFSTNDEGGFTNYCRDDFSEACNQEVGPQNETITINANTIALTLVQALGITTREKSIAAFPSCAPTGRYPIELVIPLPPAEIQSFDPNTGHLTFIDSRRPDDVNCIVVRTEEGPHGKRLRARYLIVSENIRETVAFTRGPGLRCASYNDLCVAETTIEGNFVSFAALDFSIPCISGSCMASEDN